MTCMREHTMMTSCEGCRPAHQTDTANGYVARFERTDPMDLAGSVKERRDSEAATFRTLESVAAARLARGSDPAVRTPPAFDLSADPVPRYERPEVERYLRVEYDVPGGGVVDIGLEDRIGDGPFNTKEHEEKLLYLVCESIAWTMDHRCARGLALEIEEQIRAEFPDRYWFVEVWVTDGEVKRYQVIQPAVVGGFRK